MFANHISMSHGHHEPGTMLNRNVKAFVPSRVVIIINRSCFRVSCTVFVAHGHKSIGMTAAAFTRKTFSENYFDSKQEVSLLIIWL